MQIENYILTPRMKEAFLPILLKRDGGFLCFYCRHDLALVEYVYEHLDDDRTNNDITNIVLACQSCNNKKPSSPEMKSKAMEKKKQNQRSNLLRTRERERIEVPSPSLKPELDISQANFEITHQYLSETIAVESEVDFKVALDSAVMLCRKKTGTGSQTAVRRYIDSLTSRLGPFMIVQDDQKKRVIVLREGI